MLKVGKVLKPQGIAGEIKILPYLDTPEQFAKLDTITIQDKAYTPLSIRIEGKYAFAKLKGIVDRNLAEGLRDKEIFISKASAPKLPKGRYYIDNLLGAQVWLGADLLGELINISQYGSADVYQVQSTKGKVSFPLLNVLIVEIDEKEGKIILEPKEFEKVAVYED